MTITYGGFDTETGQEYQLEVFPDGGVCLRARGFEGATLSSWGAPIPLTLVVPEVAS